MKIRVLVSVCVLLTVLCLCVPAGAFPEDLMAQAESMLTLDYSYVPVIDQTNPLPDDIKITGPFLYVGREDMEDALFVPDAFYLDYVPAGLPTGAKLRVTPDETIENLYNGLITDDPDEPVVYAVLFCRGYSSASTYTNDLKVYDHYFEMLIVDYATGTILARSDGPSYSGGAYVITSNDYFRDMNGRRVFDRASGRPLRNVWKNTLLYAYRNPMGAIIDGDTLKGVYNTYMTEYTVPEGVKVIGSYAFRDCSQLERLVLPEGVTTLESSAFEGCCMLGDITFPATLQKVEYNTLEDTLWYALHMGEPFLIVGDGLLLRAVNTGILSAVRENGELLEELTAMFGEPDYWDASTAEAIVSVLYDMGYGEEMLSAGEIIVPDGVKRLNNGCFNGIRAERLVLPGTLEDYWAENDCFFGSSFREIYVSDGVTVLPTMVFAGCEGLSRVRLPESLTTFSEITWNEPQNITIIAPKDSFAYTCAAEYGYTVEAE